MRILAVLLAAGGGTRFAGPHHKLDSVVDGETLFDRSLRHMLAGTTLATPDTPATSDTSDTPAAHDTMVAVVTGATSRQVPVEVHLVHNDRWADGQATSIASAIELADQLGADAIVFGLADQPFIGPEAWAAIVTAPAEWPIVVATYAGRRGPHPVRLHRSVWPLMPSSGDDGARNVFRAHPALVHEVPCTGSADDIDTLEDLQRWTSS